MKTKTTAQSTRRRAVDLIGLGLGLAQHFQMKANKMQAERTPGVVAGLDILGYIVIAAAIWGVPTLVLTMAAFYAVSWGLPAIPEALHWINQMHAQLLDYEVTQTQSAAPIPDLAVEFSATAVMFMVFILRVIRWLQLPEPEPAATTQVDA